MRFRFRRGLSFSLPLVAAVAVLLSLGPVGAIPASGSGYNLTFSQAAGGVSNPNVDLVALSSQDPGGSNITISYTVSGTLELNGTSDPGYGYLLFFGGTTQSNSSAVVTFGNNTTAGTLLYSSSNGVGVLALFFVLSNGGSTMTFSLAKAVVGPASTFSLNAEAIYHSSSAYVFSFLGSAYQGSGGGGCPSTGGCTPAPSGGGSSSPGNFLLYVGIIALVVVAVAVVAVVLILRRSNRPPGLAGPGGWYPGGPMPPPPPPPQAMPPPPPPATP